MKHQITFWAITLSVLLIEGGCIKEIDPQESTVTDRQAADAPGSFDNFVAAITNGLASSFLMSESSKSPYDFGYSSFYLQRDLMGHDIAMESISADWYHPWYTFSTSLRPQGGICQVPWTCYYTWIKNCNTVISLAGENPDGQKRSGMGIAYAMRAMFYMDLARMYAPRTYAKDTAAVTVPLVLETTSLTDLTDNPRLSNGRMWRQILSDLEKAEICLEGYERTDVYTPDLSVVYGLKARAYLTMEHWSQAEAYARKAQSGYTAMTEAEFTSRTDGFNTPNNAWMFGMTFKSTDDNILYNDADSSWGSEMIVEVSASGCGYAANYGAPKRIDRHLYETIPETDFRRKSFVDFAIDDMSRADVIAALSRYSDVPEGLLTTAAATNSHVVGGLVMKFRPKDGIHDNQYLAFTVAVPMMRVEEMMLIEAEAAGMQDEQRGIALLTAFAKSRDTHYVYGTHSTESYGSSYATPFQNEVWWQRRVELWGEGFATFDIKRLDKGVIRRYPGTNHTSGRRWNVGGYGVNTGNTYPNWMDLCIIQTETNYNTACVNNPVPSRPSDDSPEYDW